MQLRSFLLLTLFSVVGAQVYKTCVGAANPWTGSGYTYTASTSSVTDGWSVLPVSTRCMWKISPSGFTTASNYLKLTISVWDFPSDQLSYMALIDSQGQYLTSQSERIGGSSITGYSTLSGSQDYPCDQNNVPAQMPAYCNNVGTHSTFTVYVDEMPVWIWLDTHSALGAAGSGQSNAGFDLTYTMLTRTTVPRPCVYVINDLNPGKRSGAISKWSGAPASQTCTYTACANDCFFQFVVPPGAAKVTTFMTDFSFSSPGGFEWYNSRAAFVSDYVSVTQPCSGCTLSASSPSTKTAEYSGTVFVPITYHWRNTGNSPGWTIKYYIDQTTSNSYACAFYFNGQSGNWDDGFGAAVGVDYHTTSLWSSFAQGSNQACYYIFNRQPGYRTLTVTLSYWDTPTTFETGYWFQYACFAEQFSLPNFNISGLNRVVSGSPLSYQADGDVCLMFLPLWGPNYSRKTGSPPPPWEGFGGSWAHSNADASVGAGAFGSPGVLPGATTSGSVISGSTSASGGGNSSTSFTPPPSPTTGIVPNAPNANAILQYWWGLGWWASTPQGIINTGVPNGIFYPSNTGFSGLTGPSGSPPPPGVTTAVNGGTNGGTTASPTSGSTPPGPPSPPGASTAPTTSGNPPPPGGSPPPAANSPTSSPAAPTGACCFNAGGAVCTAGVTQAACTSGSWVQGSNTCAAASPCGAVVGSSPTASPNPTGSNSPGSSGVTVCQVSATIACCGSSNCPAGQDCIAAGTTDAECVSAQSTASFLSLFF